MERPSKTFVNCSNHPAAGWSAEQRAAAVALGCGEPLDLPGGFPPTPAEADEQELAALADETADRIAVLDPAYAFVSGDFTLTYALVNRLRARDVVCVGATSERVADVTLRPDGTADKTLHFRFVRWRRFE